MKITITGSRGCIGTHVRNSLQDHEIIEWDTKIDRDIKYFASESSIDDLRLSEFVIHLAGLTDVRESIKIPDEYWKNNVEYSKIIFDICKDIPMLYATTSCVKEWWRSPYGTSKKVMEEFAHDGHVGLRFANVYGDGAPDFMLTSRLNNGNVEYKTNHIRDFIHVSDVVDVIKFFLKRGTYDCDKVYEVGSGIGTKVADLIEKHGYDVPYKESDECEMMDNTADISKLLSLGWTGPKVFI